MASSYPSLSSDFHRERRHTLLQQLAPDALVILPSATTQYRNRDADYPFRQNSDFAYLTGFPEPDALLVLAPGRPEGEHLLFCLPKDPQQEIWTGSRAGQEGAVQNYGFDQSFPLDEMDQRLPTLMDGRSVIWYPLDDEHCHEKVRIWRQLLARRLRRGAQVPDRLANLSTPLHEMRLHKTSAEINLMQAAADISAQAHVELMRHCQPHVYEYQLASRFEFVCKQAGAEALAYNTIVGGGANACILHYVQNNQSLNAGDLVLIDAGCELEGYAADITRTFPVNGHFSAPQAALYDLVLKANELAISMVRPGVSLDTIHEQVIRHLTWGLVQLGLLTGDVDTLIADEAYKDFYMHSTSHWLGRDVHDVGLYKISGVARPLEAGMVITIEPGLYVAADNYEVDAQWRGIGIRIEDDVLVTEKGAQVLTQGVPKHREEIQALVGSAFTDSF
ncbi:Xaa-Pro aminopeptidase [Allopseudospirillum japonicum]|uniref:Xaa-Pro aminopeptidase n=1 Tax=Allopseudospirillum japonicum TaxID=64971 RepID=A0A1H6R0B7_9GAMM|nr:Xaa-Pro aminopeptidase [Allopseudospirillum japonicum]SEI45180.1 Xaa-Pro aminopeptidase [Allopseudospirillum japonicum]